MDKRLVEPYINSVRTILRDMTAIEITEINEVNTEQDEFASYGVSSAITFSGKIKGRFVIDITPDLARAMIFNMTGEKMDNVKDLLFLAGISEMNNTIAGDANTVLNNEYSLSLRLAPPIVFAGKNIMVATSKTESVTFEGTTKQGNFKLNIAFQGGL
jgi:chemotaxis protein CheX